MSSVVDQQELVYLGLDVHKDSISAGILRSDAEVPEVERIFHDEESVRRLVGRFPDRTRLRVCYEAGPTGYGLARQLRVMGVRCAVIAPSLVPTRSGDRVKTDRRDARRLARLYRAGELTAIRVPPRPRKRCGTCAGHGRISSMTISGCGSGSGRSCCATGTSTGRSRPTCGPSPTPNRSPRRWPGWAPTAASRAWVR